MSKCSTQNCVEEKQTVKIQNKESKTKSIKYSTFVSVLTGIMTLWCVISLLLYNYLLITTIYRWGLLEGQELESHLWLWESSGFWRQQMDVSSSMGSTSQRLAFMISAPESPSSLRSEYCVL